MAESQQQYITPEMKAKLEAELQQLIDNRPAIAAEINERREEGDLKENAGYSFAGRGGNHRNGPSVFEKRKVLATSRGAWMP